MKASHYLIIKTIVYLNKFQQLILLHGHYSINLSYPFLASKAKKTPTPPKNPTKKTKEKNPNQQIKKKALISAEGLFSSRFPHLIISMSL